MLRKASKTGFVLLVAEWRERLLGYWNPLVGFVKLAGSIVHGRTTGAG